MGSPTQIPLAGEALDDRVGLLAAHAIRTKDLVDEPMRVHAPRAAANPV